MNFNFMIALGKNLLNRALLFGGAGNSKGPLLLFMGSVLLWGYPMYLLKCLPLTWNFLRGSHYCFIYWNILMWLSWIVANRRDPGYVPQNSDTYYRAIKQVILFYYLFSPGGTNLP